MMRISRSIRARFVLPALAISGLLTASASGLALANGEPDLPSMKSAPEPRSAKGQIKLANDYFVGHGVAQDLQQSAYWFERAAEAGDPRAQMQIGYFYDAGIGVEKDPALAAHWYQLASASGMANAKANLGILYFWGNGVKKDEQLAIQLFREAAGKGSGLAAYYLGDVYSLGLGVPEDKAAGEQWYTKGAELHDPQAEHQLGMLYFDRPNHVHDVHKAAALFRESAAAGDVPAMYGLGLLLERNPALKKYPDEPIRLLSDAADAGVWKSSMILGTLARDGRGVPRDDSTAYYYFRVAALQGGEDAGRVVAFDLQRLAARLGPELTTVLNSRAEDWYQQHHIELAFVYKRGASQSGFPDYALALPENGAHALQMLPALPN
jgi:uncharacterized protein